MFGRVKGGELASEAYIRPPCFCCVWWVRLTHSVCWGEGGGVGRVKLSITTI